jgi:hypothetical protein
MSSMKDGLYQVTQKHFVAGFVIRNGRVAEHAPILRRGLRTGYWFI